MDQREQVVIQFDKTNSQAVLANVRELLKRLDALGASHRQAVVVNVSVPPDQLKAVQTIIEQATRRRPSLPSTRATTMATVLSILAQLTPDETMGLDTLHSKLIKERGKSYTIGYVGHLIRVAREQGLVEVAREGTRGRRSQLRLSPEEHKRVSAPTQQ